MAKPKTSLRSAPPASLPTIHKEYTADEIKAVDAEQRTVRFRISTGDLDREKDIVEPTGWQTDEFMRNPVVLFGHDYHALPVAKAVSLETDARGLSMVAQFPPAEVYPFADTVYQMVKAGYLNATSVGFKPLKWAPEPDAGTRYQAQNLIEVSIVPVPANAAALVEARSAGVDTSPLRAWAVKVLELDADAEALVQKAPAPASPDSPGVAPTPHEERPAQPSPDIHAKAGRVLSGRNESALRESVAALTAAMTQLSAVLAQVEAGQDEDEDEEEPAETPKALPPAEAPPDLQPVITITDAARQVEQDMVVLRLLDDPEPHFTLDPAMVSEVIARGFARSLATVVDARVGAALSALRGRLD